MPPDNSLRSRIEASLGESRLPALRDVVAKRPSSGPNLEALDGLRGIAVVLVLAAHADGLQQKGHGAAGVWLFFALSAFLLTRPFAEAPRRALRPAEIKRYVGRRLLRILPAYALAILTLAVLEGEGLPFIASHLVFARATGIFWTIPQEMLFYALLPVLALLHPIVFRGHPGATALGLALLAFAAHQWLTPQVFSLHGNDKLLPFHLGIFLSGMVAAYATRIPAVVRWVETPAAGRLLDALGILLLALLFFSAPWYTERLQGLGLVALEPRLALTSRGVVGGLCAILVGVGALTRSGLTHWILTAPILRTFGVLSFSLYLFHIMVQNTLQYTFGLGQGTLLFACNLAATTIVALVVYSAVERPCMQWGRSARAAGGKDSK